MKKNFNIDGQEVSAEVNKITGKVLVKINNKNYEFIINNADANEVNLVNKDSIVSILHSKLALNTDHYFMNGDDFVVRDDSQRTAKGGKSGGSLLSPMPGKVFKVLVKIGDKVSAGQTVMIVEAMKMEHPIKAPKDGEVKKIMFQEGSLVGAAQELLVIE